MRCCAGLVTFLGVVFLALLSQPVRAQAPDLVGTWEHAPAPGAEMVVTLEADGSGRMDGDPIAYKVSDNALAITVDGEVLRYQFRLDGNVLTISGGDLDEPTAFTRKSQPSKRGLGAKLKAHVPPQDTSVAPVAVGGAQPQPARVESQPAQAGPTEGEPPQTAAAGPIGTWKDELGVPVEIGEKTILLAGVKMDYTRTDDELIVRMGGVPLPWPYTINGNTLELSIAGEKVVLTRVGGPAAEQPTAPAVKRGRAEKTTEDGARGLVGNWDGPEGSVVVRDDGTLSMGGKEVRWSADATTITLTDDTGYLKIPYRLDGEKLILGTGPTQTLTRSAGGLTGVWVGNESSLDPQNFMSITQYLTLYPDGAVGFSKTEGGASRQQISDTMERFSSFRNQTGDRGAVYGQWQANGDRVTIQWQGAFGNRRVNGRLDPRTMEMVIPGMGILDESATVTFKRQ